MNIFKRKQRIQFAILVVLCAMLYILVSKFLVPAKTNTPINSIIYNDEYSLELTPQEQRWLQENPVIRLGIDRAFPPFGSITKDNKYVGLSADYIKIIEYRLGLTFAIEKDAPWGKTIKMAQSGELDMISALVNTKQRQQFLEFTSPFINNPTIIINDGLAHGYIGSLENLKGKIIAIERGSYAEGELSRNYPEIDLIPVKNTSMALSLVSIGRADAYIGNAVAASYIITKMGYHNLSFSGQTEYSSDHSIGIIKPNKILASTVKKALASIVKNDRDAIANYWFGMKTESFISQNMAIAVVSTLGGLLLFFSLWSFSLRKTKNELKKSQEIIKVQSEVDYLTGLGNRRKFYKYLNNEIKLSDINSKSFTLFFLDLDLFKEVNDSFGHAIGDLLLIEASKRITTCIGNDFGFVARIGGDEFMVILPGFSDKRVIEKAVECILSALSDAFTIEDNQINITTSIGITRYPEDAANAEQLVINGDQAMYYSKKRGRNCYSYFNKAMQQEAQYKASLTRDLRVAVDENQFALHYQPIVDLSNNTINKAEALIRWNHPQRGFVSPVEFIPLAEEAGLINAIGEWAFEKAIDHTANIRNRMHKNFQMTINTSPLQYRKNGMDVSSWSNYLESRDLTGENIIVEITEGILMETSKSAIKKLFQLRDLKIGVAIDDFGTGYSSLSYLKKFDIDFLKIDQSFVRNLTVDSDDVALVQAIIIMAHRLGIKVIAEGIETKAQKEILIEAGCDFGQGFYYSKALNAQDFLSFLKNWSQDEVQKELV